MLLEDALYDAPLGALGETKYFSTRATCADVDHLWFGRRVLDLQAEGVHPRNFGDFARGAGEGHGVMVRLASSYSGLVF